MSAPSNVVDFPDRPSRSWRLLEGPLRELLATSGLDAPAINHACTVCAKVWDRIARQPSPDTSGDGESNVRSVNAWVTQLAVGALAEVAWREAVMFNAGISPPIQGVR